MLRDKLIKKELTALIDLEAFIELTELIGLTGLIGLNIQSELIMLHD